GTATEGWNIEKITDESPFGAAGFTGVGFTATTPQTTKYDATGLRRAELFVVQQPGGGAIEVVADGQLIGRVDTEGPKGKHALEVVGLPENSKDVTFRTRGGAVRLDGVALETELPGVTLDSLGLPGATAQVLLRENEQLFADQLAARSPSLVVLMIGGNDAFDMSLNRYDATKGRAWMQQMIERVKAAAPQASCLLASPPDAGIWRMDDTIAPRKQTQEVAAYMRELAQKNGCALWDMQAAMGGEGAISRWWDAGLMNRDLVHPLALGGDVLGYLFESALERARVAHHKRHGRKPARRLPRQGQTPPPPRRYLENPEALSPFFAKLRTLERARIGRVAIVQIGASHTAAHFFTDETRKLLSDRFGGAGRGYVAAGKSSPRLEQAGVTRSLSGTWNVSDALKQRTSGLPWGLTGIRADAQPGARLLMSFEETNGSADDTSHLQLHYLEQPNQPPPEVTIDGTLVPIEQQPATDTVARVLDFAAPGGKHQLSIQNVGQGVLSLYGVSHELMKPGTVYDAFGLPGSTASVFASYDQQALAVQLNARQPDLFVFFFGTNESALPPDRLDEMKNAYPQIFKTARRAAPDAACLILAPTDRMSAKKKVWREAESIAEVVDAMRQIAKENGCAFWDTRAVMGGKGSIDVWRKQGLAHRDHVHLNPEGYRKLAGELIDELLRDYDAWSPAP
ncbi:MAG: GDSL-type esterase/lipase family protein, partial [Archangium sp.]